MRLWIGRIISYALAMLWSVAGIAKLVSIVLPSLNQSPVPPWSAQFPVVLIVLVSIVEIILALMLIAGRRKQGLVGGLILLAGFAAMVVLFPPTPAQTCGCLGELTLLDADAMLSHIILPMGFHTLGYSVLATKTLPKQSTSPNLAERKPPPHPIALISFPDPRHTPSPIGYGGRSELAVNHCPEVPHRYCHAHETRCDCDLRGHPSRHRTSRIQTDARYP